MSVMTQLQHDTEEEQWLVTHTDYDSVTLDVMVEPWYQAHGGQGIYEWEVRGEHQITGNRTYRTITEPYQFDHIYSLVPGRASFYREMEWSPPPGATFTESGDPVLPYDPSLYFGKMVATSEPEPEPVLDTVTEQGEEQEQLEEDQPEPVRSASLPPRPKSRYSPRLSTFTVSVLTLLCLVATMNQVGAQNGPKRPRNFRHPRPHLTLEMAKPFTDFIRDVLHLRNESEIENALRDNKQAAAAVVRQCIQRGRIWMVPFSVPANGGRAYQDKPIAVGMLEYLTTNSVSVEQTICKDSKGRRLNMTIYDFATKTTGLDLRKKNLPALIATGEEFHNGTLFEFPVEMLRIATEDDVRQSVSHAHPQPTYPTGDAVQALFGRKRPFQESESAHSSRTSSPRASGSRQNGQSEEPLRRSSFAAAYAGQPSLHPMLGRHGTPSRAIRLPNGTAAGAPAPEVEVIEHDADRVEMLEQQVEQLRSYYATEMNKLNSKLATERQKKAELTKQLTELNQKAWDWSHVANDANAKLEAAEKNVEMYKRRCGIAEGEVKMLKDRIKQLERALEGSQSATASPKEGTQEGQSTETAHGPQSEDSEEVDIQEPKGPRTPPGNPLTPTEKDLLEGVEHQYENIDEDEVLKVDGEGDAETPSDAPPLIMPPDAPPRSATYQIDASGWAPGYIGSFETDAEASTSSAAATAGSSSGQAETGTSGAGLS
ncbi:hypothetical protein AAVH_08844 [Aphelenchoides avenae]|nr:hypothetical protein AAVH_08844 [Aphelenchus avenae]